MKRRTIVPLASLAASLAAGAQVGCSTQGAHLASVRPLVGSVDFGPSYRVQATMDEVSAQAVVSLIDAASGNTLATGQTDSSGAFTLTFPQAFAVLGGQPFILEAAKGLSAGGLPNRAGTSLARVRTVVAYQMPSDQWQSLGGESSPVVISRSTTALSILAGAAGLPLQSLLGSLDVGQPDPGDTAIPDTFTSPTPSLTESEYETAFGLVDTALRMDEDPVACIEGPASALVRVDSPFRVSRLSPTFAASGSVVTLFGSHFPPDASLLTVELGPASGSVSAFATTSVPVTAVASDDAVTFTLPDLGTATGAVSVGLRLDATTVDGPNLDYEGD